MMIMAIVNLTNVVLNYILIYGALGVPALGMPGGSGDGLFTYGRRVPRFGLCFCGSQVDQALAAR